MFHTDTVSARSRVLNQCTIDLPHGGQPMPCTQPLSTWTAMIMNREAYSAGIRPKLAMMTLDSNSPSGRKYFGLLRSDTEPMRNFDNP